MTTTCAWFNAPIDIKPQPNDHLASLLAACPSLVIGELLAHYCKGTRGTYALAGLRNSSRFWRECIPAPDYLRIDDAVAECIRAGDVKFLCYLNDTCFINYNRALCSAASAGRADICEMIRKWTARIARTSQRQIYVALNRTHAISAALCAGREDIASSILDWTPTLVNIKCSKVLSDVKSKCSELMMQDAKFASILAHLHEYASDHEYPSFETRMSVARVLGYDLMEPERSENSILINSARIGDIENIVFALDHGATMINAALRIAARNGHVDVVVEIIRRTTPFKLRDSTILKGAGKSGSRELCEYIIHHPNVQRSDDIMLAVRFMLAGAASRGCCSIFNLVLEWVSRGLIEEQSIGLPDVFLTALKHGRAHFAMQVCDEMLRKKYWVSKGGVLGQAARSGDIATWKVAKTYIHSRVGPEMIFSKSARRSIIRHAIFGGNGWIVRDAHSLPTESYSITISISGLLDILAEIPVHNLMIGENSNCACARCKFYRKCEG